jgi:TP901 family phage tail tape measure protein
MADTVGKIKAVLGLSTRKFTQGLKTAQKKTRIFGKTAKRVGSIVAGALSFGAVIQGTRKTIKTFADFSYEMSRLEAISGATSDQLKTLRQQAKTLGGTTQRTASQVAGLQVELSKKGFSPDQINAATEGIVKLSIAAGEDLPQSAEIAAGVMNAFGMEAKEMSRIADVMAKSFSESALDLHKFQLGMSKVAPVARQAGMNIEQTSAILGTLVDSNVKASTASAQLRNILITVNKEGLSLKQALDQIKNSTDKMGTATEMFGKRASPIASILAENQNKTKQLTKSFNNAEGAAQGMADTMQDNLKGDLIAAGSALEALMIEAGQSENSGLRGIVKNITEKIRDMTDNIGDTIDTIKTWAKIIGRTVAGFAALKLAIGAYLTIAKAARIATKAWVVVQKGLNIAMKANPIGIIVTAATTLAGVIYTLWQRSMKFRAVLKTIAGKVGGFFKKVANAAKALFQEGPRAAAKAWKEVESPDYKEILQKERAKKLAKEAGHESAKKWKDAIDKGLKDNKDIEETAKKVGQEVGKSYADGVKEAVKKPGAISTKDMLGPILSADEAKKKTGTDISMGGLIPDDAGMNIQKTKDNLKDYSNMIIKAQNDTSILGSVAKKAFQGMSNSLQRSLENGKNILDSFGKFFIDMLKSLIIKLTAAAIAAFALSLILGGTGIGKAIGVGKAFGSGGFMQAFGALSGFGMAEGGVVPSGFPDDTFPARLTSGEVVLNQKQLKNIGSRKLVVTGHSIDMNELYIGIKEQERVSNNTI